MTRRLLQLLMFVILAQATLVAADAHVLHEVSGELAHHHLLHNDSPAKQTDESAGDQACQHHCCHGYNFQYLKESLTLPATLANTVIGWGYNVHYVPPSAAPEFRPPIV